MNSSSDALFLNMSQWSSINIEYDDPMSKTIFVPRPDIIWGDPLLKTIETARPKAERPEISNWPPKSKSFDPNQTYDPQWIWYLRRKPTVRAGESVSNTRVGESVSGVLSGNTKGTRDFKDSNPLLQSAYGDLEPSANPTKHQNSKGAQSMEVEILLKQASLMNSYDAMNDVFINLHAKHVSWEFDEIMLRQRQHMYQRPIVDRMRKNPSTVFEIFGNLTRDLSIASHDSFRKNTGDFNDALRYLILTHSKQFETLTEFIRFVSYELDRNSDGALIQNIRHVIARIRDSKLWPLKPIERIQSQNNSVLKSPKKPDTNNGSESTFASGLTGLVGLDVGVSEYSGLEATPNLNHLAQYERLKMNLIRLALEDKKTTDKDRKLAIRKEFKEWKDLLRTMESEAQYPKFEFTSENIKKSISERDKKKESQQSGLKNVVWWLKKLWNRGR